MAYSTNQFDEELMHYGVLGMRWGHRKAQPTSGNGSSRYRKAVNKFTNSKIGSKYKLHDDPDAELREVEGTPKKNKVSKESTRGKSTGSLYSKVSHYEAKQSRGKEFVKTLLLGPSGRTTYNMAKATDHSRAGAFARTFFDINVGTLAGSAASMVTSAGATRIGMDDSISRTAGTAASISTQYAMDQVYRNRGTAASLQQRAMMKKYRNDRRN